MDVRLPNGKIIRGIPEGTTRSEIRQKLLAAGFSDADIDGPQADVNPTEGMTGGQKFLAGVGKAFSDAAQGARQLAATGADIGGGIDTNKGALQTPSSDALRREVDEMRARDKPLMRTGGGFSGNVVGNAALLAPAASIPGVNTIGGSALLGAASGALQPTATGENRGTNMAVGGAAGAIMPAVLRGARVGVAAAEPFHDVGRNRILARVLQRAAGDDPGVAQRLAAAQELVPGSAPTAAEVSGNANVAALQRMAAQADPEAYAARASSQNEARRASLFNLAGTSGEREFHATARDTAAKQLYDDAYVAGADIRRDAVSGQFRSAKEIQGVRGEITKLLKRPAIQEAVKRAQKLAANEGEQVKNPFASVKGMDYTKRALDDMIEDASGNDARILKAVKDRLLTTVDKLSPKYALARKTFRDQSRPINQMDVAQEISDRATNPLTEQIQPQRFAQLLSDDTAARVTGNSRATLANTLEPEQLAQLRAIQGDLARSVEARDLGRGPGSNTFQNFAMANVLEESGVPRAMRGMRIPQIVGGVVGRAGNAIYSDADETMRRQLAQLLLNPREASALMSAAPRQLTEQQRRLVQALRFSSSALPIGAVQAEQ